MSKSRLHYFFLFGIPLLVFSAFLTEIKLIPSLANNIGLFEVIGGFTIAVFVATHGRRPLALNPVIILTGVLFSVAALSLVNIPYESLDAGLIQTFILLFLFLFLLALYNLFIKYQIDPAFLLRHVTLAALIIGPWILRQGFVLQGDLDAVGPFRNRAHMGIYMLTAFWLVLVFAFWPEQRRTRWLKGAISTCAAALCLYAVAISGRRSVYLALFLGLAALILVFLLILRRRRIGVAMTIGFSITVLSLLYIQGAELIPRGDFFRSRVGMVGSRVRIATDAISGESEGGFLDLQMQAVKAAVYAHPVIGLGWGSFHEWELNPTRHEVHSTPLRFLAETGITGLAVYLLLLIRLLTASARLTVRMRASPYAASYLILAVAIWSLTVSYLYNRHISERTFWLLLLVFLLLEAFAEGYQRSQDSRVSRSFQLAPHLRGDPELLFETEPQQVLPRGRSTSLSSPGVRRAKEPAR